MTILVKRFFACLAAGTLALVDPDNVTEAREAARAEATAILRDIAAQQAVMHAAFAAVFGEAPDA